MFMIKVIFLTSLAVISQTKVTHPRNKDVEDTFAINEDRANINFPQEVDVDSLTEDENVVNSLAISNDERTKNDDRRSLIMPEKLAKRLKDLRSYSDVKRVLAEHFVEDENALKKREAVLAPAYMTCPTPRATKVKTFGVPPGTQATPLYSMPKCSIKPVVVEIKSPLDGYYYPSFITLHRCMGSCGPLQPGVHQCEVVEEQELVYEVIKVTYSGLYNNMDIKLRNHTKCACDCVTKEHHCNPAKMRYDQSICQCKCIDDGKSCPNNKRWNKVQCQCECRYAQVKCERGYQWSTDTCGCEPKV